MCLNSGQNPYILFGFEQFLWCACSDTLGNGGGSGGFKQARRGGFGGGKWGHDLFETLDKPEADETVDTEEAGEPEQGEVVDVKEETVEDEMLEEEEDEDEDELELDEGLDELI